ncbi:DUF2635 domain-containing protein [Escherichia coli]|uniref:DUF2635 domain-containing protein n=1 Tax=Escherichia coli TaxID=562 RepID=UPI0009436D3C|nr:DUF2635 domain-containing protein [Escherichia coli]
MPNHDRFRCHFARYPGDPSRLLPDEGAEVPDRDLFWRRRLKQGDVVLADKATTAASGKVTVSTAATGSTAKGGDA